MNETSENKDKHYKVNVESGTDIHHRKATEEIRWRNEDLELMIAINNAVNQKESMASVINLVASRLKEIFHSHLLSVFIPDFETRELKRFSNELDQGLVRKVERLIGRKIPEVRLSLNHEHPFTEVDRLGKGIIYVGKKEVARRLAGYLPATPWPSIIQKTVKRLLPSLCDLLNYKSSAAIPLIANGITVGYMDLGTRETLTGRDLVRLQSIADHLASVIFRFQSEEKLRESEERMMSAFTFAAIGMAFVAPDGKWLKINPAIPAMLGYTEEELLAKTFQDITHPEDIEKDLDNVSQMLNGTIQSYQMEKRYFHKSGRIVWAMLSVSLVHDQKGRPLHFISQIQDITARKQAGEAISESERKYRTLYETMAQGVVYQDKSGRIIFANPAAERILGLTANQLQGKSTEDTDQHTIHEDGSFFPGHDHPAWVALKTGKISVARMGVFNPVEQKYRWINVNAIPEFRIGDREPFQVCTTFEDITDLKNAIDELSTIRQQLEFTVNDRTRELQEINSFQKAILDNASSVILTTDLNGIIQTINPAGEKMTGYSAAELIGRMTPLDFHDKEEQRQFITEKTGNADIPEEEQFSLMLADMLDNSSEWTFVKKNGQRIPVKISLSSLIGSDGKLRGLMGLITDVTHEKEYLDAIRKSEAENRAIIHAVPDLMFRLRRDGVILDYLSANDSLLYLPKSKFIGQLISNVMPAELAMPTMHALRQTFESNEVEQFEYTLPVQGTDHNYENRIIAISDDEALSIIRDITNSYQAQKALEEAKTEAEKANHAKSEFLSRMSHELRTPMNSILGFAQLLEMGDLSPKQKKGVSHIINQGRHLLRLINEVLDISGIEAGRQVMIPESVRLNPVIRDVVDSLQLVAENKQVSVEIRTHQGENPFVMADRLRLKQILLNLINNAIKYNVEGGTVVIGTTFQPVHDQQKQQVRTSIIDSGLGIPAEDISKLFQPFERVGANKTDVEGTGLGLMLVKKITEAMGGSVGVESEPGKGSTFWFELPAVIPDNQESESPSTLQSSILSGSQKQMTILYVEDNQSNIELVESIFSAFRPSVNIVTTCLGSEAQALAIAYKPHLILLDLDLPDVSGVDVLKILLSDNQTAAIPVVVVSADATPHQINSAMEAGARDYITKPLEVAGFLKTIDSYLP